MKFIKNNVTFIRNVLFPLFVVYLLTMTNCITTENGKIRSRSQGYEILKVYNLLKKNSTNFNLEESSNNKEGNLEQEELDFFNITEKNNTGIKHNDSLLDKKNLNTTKQDTAFLSEKFYQGSVLFAVPPSLGKNDRINFNIYNSFHISNSSVTQFMDKNNSNREEFLKGQEEIKLEAKLKKLENKHKLEEREKELKYEEKIKELAKLNRLEEVKIKVYQDLLASMRIKQNEEKDKIKTEYENKMEIIKKGNNDVKVKIKKEENEIDSLKQENLQEKKEIKEKNDLIEKLQKQIKNNINDEKGTIMKDKEELIQTNNILKNSKLKINKNETQEKSNSTSKMKANNKTIEKEVESFLPKTINKTIGDEEEEGKSYLLNVVKELPKPKHRKSKHLKKTNNTISFVKALERVKGRLNCMVMESNEAHHFKMNFEKCKELNSIYLEIHDSLEMAIHSVYFLFIFLE
jgi:hypothetical protein